MRRIIFSDLPRFGRFTTDSIGAIARDMGAGVGASSCVEHSVSEVREFEIDGHDAAELIMICRGLVVDGRVDARTINVRRTVLVMGETRVYNFQADQYAPMAALDPAASAASWDEAVASLRWCADNISCAPR
ncbi:hypothetical protein [Terricaulis silvestris]|uniref:hypothetical protein n=1 Tax=Terricaulis silvestris TaxID=2686094 RepID=UPI001E2E940E|nr:hypothetical protein [Terricaulis silvestris]